MEKNFVTMQKKNDEIKIFLEQTFKRHKGKSFTNLFNILNSIDLPCLTNEQKVKLHSLSIELLNICISVKFNSGKINYVTL